ncbi:16S rRNA (guanine(527)-N(7))-methyltransferase RsmG [Candidatus Fokinia crypta]|uniref:Ribosomal RNA small subunit methyltransferase G n=1 Tax=Candidatus Fokinia crypta TaxID=1920990 RepID=A0ABZ0URA8_9RICK|nr:RsmG family class I SAM-dependent methyltransferase [Candidatus Fokinia cryptica]WPX97786.1 Ribosomal RNA small subunit methyltransferase G [Candidatus Fokinia cryptica]
MKTEDINLIESIQFGAYKKIVEYLAILQQVNNHVNLCSSKLQFSKLLNYVMRSVELHLTILKFNSKSLILDIGSGNGLPSIILSILGAKVIMVDSNSKKCAFLTLAVSKLNLDAKIINSRIEKVEAMQIPIAINNCITITALAFSTVKKLLNACIRNFECLSHLNVSIFLMKGENIEYEILEASKRFKFQSTIINSTYDEKSRILVLTDISSK